MYCIFIHNFNLITIKPFFFIYTLFCNCKTVNKLIPRKNEKIIERQKFQTTIHWWVAWLKMVGMMLPFFSFTEQYESVPLRKNPNNLSIRFM